MIKKQNLRINVLAAAVLSLTGVGLAQAADLKANAPLSGPKTQQVDGIIVKYRAGSAAAADANAKLAVVNSAIARALPAAAARPSTKIHVVRWPAALAGDRAVASFASRKARSAPG